MRNRPLTNRQFFGLLAIAVTIFAAGCCIRYRPAPRAARIPVIAGPCMPIDELPVSPVERGKTYTAAWIGNRWMACPPQQSDLRGAK